MPEPYEFDPLKVNVQLETDSNTLLLYFVSSTGQCAEAADAGSGGWFYDDPRTPMRIIFCPEACERIVREGGGEVTIMYGCSAWWP
jgi:hypothetical protein